MIIQTDHGDVYKRDGNEPVHQDLVDVFIQYVREATNNGSACAALTSDLIIQSDPDARHPFRYRLEIGTQAIIRYIMKTECGLDVPEDRVEVLGEIDEGTGRIEIVRTLIYHSDTCSCGSRNFI